MKTMKYLAILLMAISLSSCQWDIMLGQENGNGNVRTEERHVGDFNGVHSSAGLHVYLTEGSENKVVVEADDNLHQYIEVYLEGNTLKIGTEKNIGRAKAKNVHVTFTNLESLKASSGSDLISNSVIKSEILSLETSSGADLEAEIVSKEVYLEASSGSDLKVSGRAGKAVVDASSGSDIKARELEVLSCNAEASSGADVAITVLNTIEAHASSGGDIQYFGNPSDVSVNDGPSGSVRKM